MTGRRDLLRGLSSRRRESRAPRGPWGRASSRASWACATRGRAQQRRRRRRRRGRRRRGGYGGARRTSAEAITARRASRATLERPSRHADAAVRTPSTLPCRPGAAPRSRYATRRVGRWRWRSAGPSSQRLAAPSPAVRAGAAGRHERRPDPGPAAGRDRRQGPLREGDRGGAARRGGPTSRSTQSRTCPALLPGRARHRVHSRPRRPARRPRRPDARHARARCRRARAWAPRACGAWSSLKAIRPDLDVVPMRGNVDTRLRKVDEGEFDAIVLARAGLVRLGLAARATRDPVAGRVAPRGRPGGPRHRVPRQTTPRRARVLAPLHDPETATCVAAERGVLIALGGDCRTPLGAYAERAGTALRLRAFVARRPTASRRRDARERESPVAGQRRARPTTRADPRPRPSLKRSSHGASRREILSR